MSVENAPSTDRAVALLETLVSIFELRGAEVVPLRAALERVSPEDVAAVLGDFDRDRKVVLFRALPSHEDRGIVLEETDRHSRKDILEAVSEQERHAVIGEMPIDDLVDHLGELPEDERRRLIASLDAEDAQDVRELLAYPEHTAGGMMTTEFITAPVGASSRDVLGRIQGNLTAEIINYVYVVEGEETLVGVVSIRQVLRASPDTLVDSYMETDLISVRTDTDREEVAAVLEKYNLPALPVLDSGGDIRGIVTFDDVIEVVQEENSEDMLRMAGTTSLHPMFEPLRVDVAKRLPFLMVTMFGGFAVALVLDTFKKNVIGVELFASMVIWIHLVSALSGNVAVVTSTVMVRGLATGDIGARRLRRAVLREFGVALIIACIVATVAAGAYWGYDAIGGVGSEDVAAAKPDPTRAIIALAAAMTGSLAWAGLVGGLVPVLCRLSRVVDPAIASGPFVTITCDISASVIFLLMIRWLLA